MKARIKFKKYGALRFIGHLDVMRYFQKVMRRAQIPIAFTGGYSPHMIMSFASPLGIGLTSEGEYFDIELTEPIESEKAVRQMNEVGVEGIEVLSFRQIAEEKKATGMAIVAAADYLVGKGVPFRDAHGIIGRVVLYCIDKGIAIDDMSLEELKEFSEVFEEDIYDAISMYTCVNKRLTIGAPGKEAMEREIAACHEFLEK